MTITHSGDAVFGKLIRRIAGTWTVLLLSLPAYSQVSTTILTPDSALTERASIYETFDPSGSFICTLADFFTDNARELYCAASSPAGPMVRVSGALISGENVANVVYLNDGLHVLYAAKQDDLDVEDIYLARMDGVGGPQKLTNSPWPMSNISILYYFPNRNAIVFVRANSAQTGEYQMVNINLNQPQTEINLNALIPKNESFNFISAVSKKHDTVLFNTENGENLYSLRLDTMTVTTLDQALIPAFYLLGALTPDELTYVYRATPFSGGREELFSVPIHGGPVHQLSPNGLPTLFTEMDFSISPSGDYVVFQAATSQDVNTGDSIFSFYSAPVRGNMGATLLQSNFDECDPGSDCFFGFDAEPQFSQDEQRVVFSGHVGPPPTLGNWHLYSAPIDGSNATSTLTQSAYFESFMMLPDRDQVATLSADEIRTYAVDGSSVSIPTSGIDWASDFILEHYYPDLGRLVMRALVNGHLQYISVSLQGGEPFRLSGLSNLTLGTCGGNGTAAGSANFFFVCEKTEVLFPMFTLIRQTLKRVQVGDAQPLQIDLVTYGESLTHPGAIALFQSNPVRPHQLLYLKFAGSDVSGIENANLMEATIDEIFVSPFSRPFSFPP